jgi:hypothetical protein
LITNHLQTENQDIRRLYTAFVYSGSSFLASTQ